MSGFWGGIGGGGFGDIFGGGGGFPSDSGLGGMIPWDEILTGGSGLPGVISDPNKGSGGGGGTPSKSGSPQKSSSSGIAALLSNPALLKMLAATGGALFAHLLNGQNGMNTSKIDQANAQRSADYQKNFVKIPYMQRGLAALPRGYNPIVTPDPPRFQVTLGSTPAPAPIPAAGTGQPILNAGGYAAGGQAPSHEGIVNGPGGGMDDHIPARSGQQEIRLSDGEFVLPADIVSSIGDGSTSAGAKRLYKMMERIRKQKYGRPVQPSRLPRVGGGILPG
jgi:hypothetical protein